MTETDANIFKRLRTNVAGGAMVIVTATGLFVRVHQAAYPPCGQFLDEQCFEQPPGVGPQNVRRRVWS
jgi:hypothetical protein